MFKKIDSKQTFPKMEEEILEFWKNNKIFQKSLENRKNSPQYSFYDGPPFATGTPHYGHLVASTMKDVVPRYWTMRGYYVERKWGWDCHGLPIENIVEKELGSKNKKDIENLGVEKFNELCRSKVLEYVQQWQNIIGRLGRWADMENAYKTMDLNYMESVWWVFKQLWDKGLIYESYRAMHICPRCETTLSQSEVAEGYMTVKDLSAMVKFELLEDPGTYFLAWTTTPWTLIGNVALAVGEDIDYVCVQVTLTDKAGNFFDEKYWLAKEKITEVLKNREYEILEEKTGKELAGKKYRPIFDYYQNNGVENSQNGWMVYEADFVNTSEGTGIVHIAPAFGEDDMELGKKMTLPFIQHVGMDGVIKKEAVDFAGLNVKPSNDRQATDIEIIKYLAKNNSLFAKEKYEHSYPHCWRCDTPLLNYATSSWFVDVTQLKPRALETAENISWVPSHMKEGRFGKWLENARDWSVSRQRFWASVIPIWRCECGEIRVFGSVAELEEVSGEKISDIHKHIVDKISFDCQKCGEKMRRVPDVLDTWFDSGSMPYAQQHYPFKNKEQFERSFPAQFIAEGQDQTRTWFYYLHIISTAILDSHAFGNVIVNGIVLAEDGKKMSKRLQNYPDPQLMFDKYGADAMRLYLMSSPVVFAQNLNFSEKDVAEFVRGALRMLWNSYSFFVLYANIDGFNVDKITNKSENILDKWMLSELNNLIKEVNVNMEKYDLSKTARLFPGFIDNLSNWFIRRSRKRFWKSESDNDKHSAYSTLYEVLVKLSQLMAPFTPFIADEVYKNLTGKESVHLSDFPEADVLMMNDKLNQEMAEVRAIVSAGLQLRASAKIKVRQPLSVAKIAVDVESLELQDIIKDELNVKNIEIIDSNKSLQVDKNIIWDSTGKIGLDIRITEDLRVEGEAREIIRFIQEMRKEANYDVDNRIDVWYNGKCVALEIFGNLIAKEILANNLSKGTIDDSDISKKINLENGFIEVFLKKN